MGTLRDKILAARELPRQEVATPEWAPFGVPSVHVRGFTVAEATDYAKWNDSDGDNALDNSRMATKVCAMVIVDENGERVFTEEADAELLQGMAVSVIARIVRAANDQSGFTTEANPSTGDQNAPSSSGSPSPSVSPTQTI